MVFLLFLPVHVEGVRVLLVELRERPDAVRPEEFVLVEHLRQDPPEPLLVDQRQDSPLGHALLPRARRVHRRRELGHPAMAFERAAVTRGTRSRSIFDDRRGRQREQPDHRAHLEPLWRWPSGSRSTS